MMMLLSSPIGCLVLASVLLVGSADAAKASSKGRGTVVDDPSLDFSLGNSTTQSNIVGGRPAPRRRFPFYVHPRPGCGGTLIHPDIALTAAHCGDSAFGIGTPLVIGGILKDGSDGESIDIESICIHPDYDSPRTYDINDIMLVKLESPSTAPLVTLNFDATLPKLNDVVIGIGFGNVQSGGSDSPILLQVSLDTYIDKACVDEYRDFVPETMVCAGTEEGGKDTCQNDSGGPIFTTDLKQVGITSYGNGCGLRDIPAAYTEVAAFETFIKQGICALSSDPPDDCTDSDTTAFTCQDERSTGRPFTRSPDPTPTPTSTLRPTASSSPLPTPVAVQPRPTAKVPTKGRVPTRRPTKVVAPTKRPTTVKAPIKRPATPVKAPVKAPIKRPTTPVKAPIKRPATPVKASAPTKRPVTVVIPKLPSTIAKAASSSSASRPTRSSTKITFAGMAAAPVPGKKGTK